MSFGEKGIEQKHWSEVNFEIAIKKLQNEMPTFGQGGNTRQENDKFFVMGFEVKEDQYNVFLDRFEELSGIVIDRKNEELEKLQNAA